MTSKARLRARLLATRRATRAGAAERAVAVRAALLAALPELLAATDPGARPGPVVAAYAPFGDEPGGPDLPVVLAAALRPSGRVLLPVLRTDLDLDWAWYDGTLGGSGRGPAEPAGPRLDPTAVAEAALLVVPALAVDRRGVRLGRGGGSYDRTLARVPSGVPVVALLHDGELLDEDLPAEPHDRRVTAVITPGLGLVRLPGPE